MNLFDIPTLTELSDDEAAIISGGILSQASLQLIKKSIFTNPLGAVETGNPHVPKEPINPKYQFPGFFSFPSSIW